MTPNSDSGAKSIDISGLMYQGRADVGSRLRCFQASRSSAPTGLEFGIDAGLLAIHVGHAGYQITEHDEPEAIITDLCKRAQA